MNKYLLRGFGVGCVFAAVLLFFINKPKTVTDDEIISKAKSLGMVTSEELEEKLKEERLNAIKESLNRDSEDSKEQPVAEAEPVTETEPVAETEPEETPEEPVEPVEEPAEEPVEEIEPAEEPANEPAEKPVEEPAEEPAEEIEPAKETPEEPAEDDDHDDVDNPFDVYYKLTISRGMSSEKVSAALEAAGVIGSAADFNSYLVRNGKSSVINVGVFDIPYDSDYDVIADIITK
ncbi:MAG: hypothetical protein IKS09_01460 [Lachnospiraceae bacterium]|nr:hypothetical protein [Lachnospiraceae bacterium]